MNSSSTLFDISYLLIEWYNTNKRDLPWRQTTDPYKIWISEIILQQTRVDQGLPYFESIINRYPDVYSLANASLDDVMKLWQGLGYYSRARNMHTAAIQVVRDFGGVFPADYEKLLELKGIGKYTAAAIASFAYRIPKAVLDGNVFRVLSRLFAIETPINTTEGKNIFINLAEELLDLKNPDIYNQAIMDFGAIQCVPSKPDCINCLLSDHCLSFASGNVQKFPVRLASAKKRDRYFHYFYITDGHSVWLQQRTQKDIWQQLWEFPLIESKRSESIEWLLKQKELSTIVNSNIQISRSYSLNHVLTHQIIHAQFFTLHIKNKAYLSDKWKEVPLSELDQYAVSRLIELFIEKHF
jgi:A/G-specific adenine glycosylase